jgi:uncharacterized protein YjbI with pentapeptide repeats
MMNGQNTFAESNHKINVMQNSKSIGNKITTARKKINLSRADLAQQVSISLQAVGKWERGESVPDIITLSRLTKILGVDLNYFSELYQPVNEETASVQQPPEQRAEWQVGNQKKDHGWNMSDGNWVDADFSGLKNLSEKFTSSNMQSCRFIGSDMSDLFLKDNNFDRCDFTGSKFNNCKIEKSNFEKNLFSDCSLRETEFSGSYIQGSDFSGANFSKMIFKSGGFEKNTIARTIWNNTIFIDTKIVDIVFEGTLHDCSFEKCGFKRVTFQNSTLINIFFKHNYTLKQVKFIDCKADRLTYEFLKIEKADLSGITLLP